jgi:nucleoid-associated protein YgaU
MGFIEFVKIVGRKLGVEEDRSQVQSPQSAGAPEQKAAALATLIRQLGLSADDLDIRVEGDQVTLTGTVESQAEREKIVLLVGNTEGIGRVDDQLQVARPEPPATLYTVQSGDTLSKIAQQHYGNANQYPRIFEANRPLLRDPDEIYPGQVLRIPR